MVVLEANVISHFMEPVDIPDPDRVDRFLAGSRVPARLDPDRPAFVGGVVNQKQFRDYRRLSQAAMQEAAGVMEAVGRDFGDVFGRRAGLIEAVDVEDADLVLVTAGTITSTARHTIDRIKRRSGVRIGLLKIRVFRPFPKDAVRNAVRGAGRFAVIDRNVSLGGEGIFCSEFKAALIHHPGRPRIQGYLAGIGGTDVDPDAIERVINDALNREEFSDQPIWVTEDE
jgi:pyruvate/2-oxoacid:ferredoxin oxidoreductase alpha subunit